MKKYFVVITLLLLLPCIVFADDFVTLEGYTISEATYNNLSQIFSEHRLYTMSYEDYLSILNMNFDYSTIQRDIKYIRTDYNNETRVVTNTVVSESDINSSRVNEETRSSIIETSYKRQQLVLVKTDSVSAYSTLVLTWLTMPSVRSYDVIAMRYVNMGLVSASQQGLQTYRFTGDTSYGYVNYRWNGTNINNQAEGFGISMNLKDGSLDYLQCEIDASFIISAYPASLFGSYQHAVSNITLANSKDYYISNTGLGGVISYYNGQSSYYDGMQGTEQYLLS